MGNNKSLDGEETHDLEENQFYESPSIQLTKTSTNTNTVILAYNSEDKKHAECMTLTTSTMPITQTS